MQGYFLWQKFYVFALFCNLSTGAKGPAVWAVPRARFSVSPPLKFPHGGLGHSPGRNQIWCILALNRTSGGNNFNDFPENQLTIDFIFLCKPTWWSSIISPFPFVLILFGGTALIPKLSGNGVRPRSTSTAGGWESYKRSLGTQAPAAPRVGAAGAP